MTSGFVTGVNFSLGLKWFLSRKARYTILKSTLRVFEDDESNSVTTIQGHIQGQKSIF